jgi:hypothetical protein
VAQRAPAGGRKDARKVNQEFLAWQEKTGRRPWFAFLNYYDSRSVRPSTGCGTSLSPGRATRVYDVTTLTAADTAAVASARALRWAIFSLDREIGVLLAELRRRGGG